MYSSPAAIRNGNTRHFLATAAGNARVTGTETDEGVRLAERQVILQRKRRQRSRSLISPRTKQMLA